MEFSEQQQHCVELARLGHNLLICGQAGTGKSTVLNRIVEVCQAEGKHVAVTATTGIACQQFKEKYHAMTMHRWAGLLDGRYSTRELCHLIQSDEKYHGARTRLKAAESLIIDEVSMLSSKLFGCLEEVCRITRECPLAFGGLQVILSGDFYQLPPVKDALYSDDGDFCFNHPVWKATFTHVIQLENVYRQNEPDLIKAVQEIAKGEVSQKTIQYVQSLRRPVNAPIQDIKKIYATNHQTDIENLDHIAEMPGDVVSFRADDTGDSSFLQKMMAPKVLHLKRLCPVVLITNLSDQLVNGSMGRVVDFGESGPIVDFPVSGVTLEIKATTFSVYSPQERRNLAERKQIPLKVGFAITAHKSQGMSLDFVQVDCHLMNRPGQLGVAIGRAKNSNGLQVKNFLPSCFVQQPLKIRNFYFNVVCSDNKDDFSCCRSNIHSPIMDQISERPTPLEGVTEVLFEEGLHPGDDLTDEELLQVDDDINSCLLENELVQLPDEFDMNTLIDSAKYPVENTTFQSKVNHMLKSLVDSGEKSTTFIGRTLGTVYQTMHEQLSKTNVQQKDVSSAYADYYAYTTSELYKSRCRDLFSVSHYQDLMPEQWDLAYHLSSGVRRQFLNKTAAEIAKLKPTINVSRSLPSSGLTSAAWAKIRYVGGYVMAKIRYSHQAAARRQMFKLDGESRQRVHKEECQVKILSEACRTEPQIHGESSDAPSLKETTMRQNIRQSLNHINDEGFRFFSALCEENLRHQTAGNLTKFGDHIHKHIVDELCNDYNLYQQYLKMFDESYSSDLGEFKINRGNLLKELFTELVHLFSKVMIKQMRKDYLAEVNRMKKLAHRKKVLSSTPGSSASSDKDMEVTYSNLLEDESAQKLEAHKMLKNYVLKMDKIPGFTKVQLQKLCEAYALPYVVRDTKLVLEQKLIIEIKQRNFLSHPEVLQESDRERVNRRGQKRKSKQKDICAECCRGKSDTEDDEWIRCARCSKWYHRVCAEIFDDAEWLLCSVPGHQFVCHNC